jgi:CubicO group peptidase (beta-lactamase class C family)
MLKLIGKILLGVLLGVVLVFAIKYKTVKKLMHAIHLFDEDVIVENFQNMDKTFDATRLEPSKNPFRYPTNISYEMIDSFQHLGKMMSVEEYLKHANSEGILILKNDTVIFERYALGLTEDETHISWSMAKSVVATLMGIAYDEGLYQLDEPVTKYLPQFAGTGYDGVKIKDILQMSSGVAFNEDYGDFNSDINRFGRAFAMGSSLEGFAKSLKRDKTPGTYCHYVSIDTQVLGLLLIKLTGKTLTAYLDEKLWQPLGMEGKCEFLVDKKGVELALGGLNMTLRDYAKLGQLYLHKGNFNGKQIVSEEWVKMAITPDAPHLMPGPNPNSSHTYGYGFQWWIPEVDEGDFFAAGIYNQYIYVQPKLNLVIVALSANHHYKKAKEEEKETFISVFKDIVRDMETSTDSVAVVL